MISDKAYNCWRECCMIALAGILVFYGVLRLLMFTGMEPWDAHTAGVTVMIVFSCAGILWRLHIHGYTDKLPQATEEE